MVRSRPLERAFEDTEISAYARELTWNLFVAPPSRELRNAEWLLNLTFMIHTVQNTPWLPQLLFYVPHSILLFLSIEQKTQSVKSTGFVPVTTYALRHNLRRYLFCVGNNGWRNRY